METAALLPGCTGEDSIDLFINTATVDAKNAVKILLQLIYSVKKTERTSSTDAKVTLPLKPSAILYIKADTVSRLERIAKNISTHKMLVMYNDAEAGLVPCCCVEAVWGTCRSTDALCCFCLTPAILLTHCKDKTPMATCGLCDKKKYYLGLMQEHLFLFIVNKLSKLDQLVMSG